LYFREGKIAKNHKNWPKMELFLKRGISLTGKERHPSNLKKRSKVVKTAGKGKQGGGFRMVACWRNTPAANERSRKEGKKTGTLTIRRKGGKTVFQTWFPPKGDYCTAQQSKFWGKRSRKKGGKKGGRFDLV